MELIHRTYIAMLTLSPTLAENHFMDVDIRDVAFNRSGVARTEMRIHAYL